MQTQEVTPPAPPTIASALKLTPQARTVLAYMQKRADRTITPMKALTVLGISRLASCIHEIRHRAGYDVHNIVKKDEVGHKYSHYTLATAN